MLPAERRDLCHACRSFPGFARRRRAHFRRAARTAHRRRRRRRSHPALGRAPDECQTFNAASEPLTDPLTGTQITSIEWMAEDALPFPFCLSGFTDEEHGAQYRDDLEHRPRQHRARRPRPDHCRRIARRSAARRKSCFRPMPARTAATVRRRSSPGRVSGRRLQEQTADPVVAL